MNRILIFLLITFSFTNSYHAANVNEYDTSKYLKIIDSYILKKDTTNLYYALKAIDYNFEDYINESLQVRLLKAAKISESSYSQYIILTYTLLTRVYGYFGDEENQLEYLLRQYSYLKINKPKDELSSLWILIDIGNIYFLNNFFEEAKAFYKLSEEIANRYNVNISKSVVYLNYGLLYAENQRYVKSNECYEKALQFRKNIGRKEQKAFIYVLLASNYAELGNSERLLKYILLTEKYYKLDRRGDISLSKIPLDIKRLYFHYYTLIGNHTLANKYLNDAKKISLKEGYTRYYGLLFIHEINVLIKKGNYLEAIKIFNEQINTIRKENLLAQEKKIIKKLYALSVLNKDEENQNALLKRYIDFENIESNSKLIHRLNISKVFLNTLETESKINYYKEKLKEEKHFQEIQNRNRIILIFIIVIGGIVILFLFKLTTKLKSAQDELIIKNKNLNEKTKSLEDVIILKDKLFSIIAHDLRNPLNQILLELANLKMLIPNKVNILPTERAVKKTIDLFEKLLQWAKLDRQTVNMPQNISLKDNIDKIIGFFISDVKLRNIQIYNRDNIDYSVFADPNLFQTLLRNLFSNAITNTPKDGFIEINVEKLDELFIELIISDSGKGFTEEFLKQFDWDNDKYRLTSSGLGLVICKQIISDYGWNMRIDNNSVYGGARIIIKIPFYEENLILKSNKSTNYISANYVFTEEQKQKFVELKNLKFYQVSDIRNKLKVLYDQETDELILNWFTEILDATDIGNEQKFKELISKIGD